MYSKSFSINPILILLLVSLFISCHSEENKMTESQLIEKAKGIHDRVITLDTHIDINVRNFTDSINYTQNLETQVTLPKMKEGGLDVAWFVVYTGQDSLNDAGFAKAYDNAMAKFDAIHNLVKNYAPDQIELATSPKEVYEIQERGKMVAMIGIENGYPVGMDISNVEKFYDLGARYMSLSHNGHSQLCDSNTGEENNEWLHNGLSDLGKEVVKEMNRLGMLIDISHPSKEAIKQMIELSKAPVIASHSSARALCDHSRNVDDEMLGWIKENGGVVQTVAFQAYVQKEKNDARTERLKELRNKIADTMDIEYYDSFRDIRALGLSDEEQMVIFQNIMKVRRLADKEAEKIEDFPPAVDVSDFVDHIDYMVDKIGLKHVGISSDFDGGGGVDGWKDASETFNVTLELVRRGYSEEEIEQLWSGNLLRALEEAQDIAQQIQTGLISN